MSAKENGEGTAGGASLPVNRGSPGFPATYERTILKSGVYDALHGPGAWLDPFFYGQVEQVRLAVTR